MATKYRKALPTPEFCPGCARSSTAAPYDEPAGDFTYNKLFCNDCQIRLTQQQIVSRGRSYVTKYRANERYQQIKRVRKYLPDTLK